MSVLLHFNVPQQCVNISQNPPRFEQADTIDVDSKTADTTRWRNFMAEVGGENGRWHLLKYYEKVHQIISRLLTKYVYEWLASPKARYGKQGWPAQTFLDIHAMLQDPVLGRALL